MTWIDLGSPHPKTLIEPYSLFRWPTGDLQRLSAGTARTDYSLDAVLTSRRTQRQFGPLSDDQLGNVLWRSCGSSQSWPSPYGFDLEQRAAPSAGAIHPIHVLICRPNDPRWWLYQPQGHYLVEIQGAAVRLEGLVQQTSEVLDSDHAVHMLFVAEPGKTLTKYKDGCSLIWRDAGALLAVVALTAQAHGLHFCPLGLTGEPWAGALSDQGQLVGVGLALIGSPP